MKKIQNPELTLVQLHSNDVIATSQVAQAPVSVQNVWEDLDEEVW